MGKEDLFVSGGVFVRVQGGRTEGRKKRRTGGMKEARMERRKEGRMG